MQLMLLFVALLFNSVNAGDTFTVNCSPLSIQRSDPIVSPGAPSSHLHSIIGGNAFARKMEGADTYKSTGTTCDKKIDMSNYWVPSLFHVRADGTYELVRWDGSAVYYQNRACDYAPNLNYCPKGFYAKAFPEHFRMIAGDSNRRTFNQTNFAHRAVSMMCFLRNGGSKEYNGFPPVDCDKIRAQVYFPSCWDGVNMDSDNHRDHMAYPAKGNYNGGVCPKSHPIALISIFFEWFFETKGINDRKYVFANGDTTGHGFHGDFIMGWTDRKALGDAHRLCVSPQNCPINTAGAAPGKNRAEKQNLLQPARFEEEVGLKGPIRVLPGNPKVDGKNWETVPANRNNTMRSSKNQSRKPSPTSDEPEPTSGPSGDLNGSYKIRLASAQKYIKQGNNNVLVAENQASTIFNIQTSSNGGMTIMSKSNNQFVTADNAGNGPLMAARKTAAGWESFTFENKGGNQWMIKSNANNKYCTLQQDGKIKATSSGSNSNSVWVLERA